MLLNHKAAVDFLVDCLPREPLSSLVVQNLHAILMQGLVPDSSSLKATRDDYARAMLAVYELRDATLAAELLSWTYQRSTTNGAAARGSGG